MTSDIWIAAVAVAACGRSGDPSAQPQHGSATVASAALAPTPSPAPPPPSSGWPHVEALGPCLMKVLAAPADERQRVLDAANRRVARFGGTAKIELTKLGDRVMRIDWKDATAPVHAPTTPAELKRAAIDLWTSDGDLFGLVPSDFAGLDPIVAPVEDVPPVAWEVHALVERRASLEAPPKGAAPSTPVRAGTGQIVVDLDRAGRLITAAVGDELLPPLAVCAATLDRAAIEQAVVGTKLAWDGAGGTQHAVSAADITSVRRTLMPISGLEWSPATPLELGVVYLVTVGKGPSFSIQIDPATAKVVSVEPNFDR